MRLSIVLPHDAYSVPIVSSRPLGNVASVLTYPAEWRKHSCANLVNVKDSFLWGPSEAGGPNPRRPLPPESTLSRDSKSKLLYSHLGCSQWRYEVWLPLGSVLGDCQPTAGGGSLQLYVAYVQVYNNTLQTLKWTSLRASLPHKMADPQAVLYSILPSGAGGGGGGGGGRGGGGGGGGGDRDIGPSLQPLASFFNRTLSHLEMYLYAILPAGRDFEAGHAGLAVGGASIAMDLLFATSTTSCTTQVWHAAVPVVGGEQYVDLQVTLEERNALPEVGSGTVTSTFSLGFNVIPAQWSIPAVVQLLGASLSTGAISWQHNFTYG